MDDTLDGGLDPDYLEGELGHDTLIGGNGIDIYKYRPNDGNAQASISRPEFRRLVSQTCAAYRLAA